MKRIAPYIASATVGIALIASNPAIAQMIGGFGLDTGYPAYPSNYSRAMKMAASSANMHRILVFSHSHSPTW
jgi:hypothetical protein